MGEVLQGKVVSCKTEALIAHLEIEEDGELAEDPSLNLDAYGS